MRAPPRRRSATGGQATAWLLAAIALATVALAACAGAAEAPATGAAEHEAAGRTFIWDAGGRVTAGEPLVAIVAVPPPAAAAAAGRRARLFIEGVEAPASTSAVGLAVFLERPDAAWDTDREVPEYAGSVAFGQRPVEGERAAESFVLDLGETLGRLGGLAAVGDLEVTLVAVPRSDDPADVQAFLASADPIRVRRLRLVLGDG